MTTVREYALQQLHWRIQKDPWVQAVMLAAGENLNQMAERVLAIYNSADFGKLNAEQVRYFEWLLGLPADESKTLDDRRAAIQAAWNIAGKPSLASIQSTCDAWGPGDIRCSYVPGNLTLQFIGDIGVPSNIDDLKNALTQTVPAHIVIDYIYRHLLIKEIHNVMALAEMEKTPLNHFAGGTS